LSTGQDSVRACRNLPFPSQGRWKDRGGVLAIVYRIIAAADPTERGFLPANVDRFGPEGVDALVLIRVGGDDEQRLVADGEPPVAWLMSGAATA